MAVSPGASPTGAAPTATQLAGSATPANNTGDPANAGSNPLADALPFMLIGLGIIVLLALLFIPVRILLRRRLVPLPAPKVPPSGAAPWSRAPVSAQAQPGQPFPFAQMGNGPFYTPSSAPAPSGFNAAPTLANAPGAAWNTGTPPAGPRPPSMQPVAPGFPGYGNHVQPPQPFPVPPAMPVTNGYTGLTPGQQPFPGTPLLPSGAQAAYMGYQPGPAASPPQGNPSGDANQPGDSFNNAARKRLRRDGLRTSGEHRAFEEQFSGDASADMMVISDVYPRAMPTQHSQQGQIVQQAPGDFNAL